MNSRQCRHTFIVPAHIIRYACVAWSLFFSTYTVAETISVTLPNNLTANADYRKGDPSKPTVFILHGFMSTHKLNIVQNIADELESNGYSILAPTLSLNINNRQSGASCEAAHTHTMESDVEEIRWWLHWLKSKSDNPVTVIGHSTGSLQLAITLSSNPPANVTNAIFTAPAYLKGKPFSETAEKKDLKIARQLKSQKNNKLHRYHMSYCKGDFVAPYNVFLSYKAWSGKELIKTIRQVKVPYTIVIAEEDHRFGPQLNDKFKRIGSRMVTVKGANHFFSSPNEFDFLDTVSKEIAQFR